MKSRPETASIEFGATSSKPSSRATIAAVGVEVHARERARAERQPSGLALGEGEARAVAREHPEVREQVVAEIDGLGALQVRVAGHRPVDVLLGAREHDLPSAPRARCCAAAALLARVHREVGDDLVVARARRVQPPADRARDLGQAALDRHVDVLVLVLEREARLAPALRRPASRPSSSASRSSTEMIPRAASIAACARDCAMSCGHSRRSNPIDAFRRRNAGSWGSRKRDTGVSLRSRRARAGRRPRRAGVPACGEPAETPAGAARPAHGRGRRRAPGRAGPVGPATPKLFAYRRRPARRPAR